MKNNLFNIIYNSIIIVIFVLILILFIRKNNDFEFIKYNCFESQKNKSCIIRFHLFKKLIHFFFCVFFADFCYCELLVLMKNEILFQNLNQLLKICHA